MAVSEILSSLGINAFGSEYVFYLIVFTFFIAFLLLIDARKEALVALSIPFAIVLASMGGAMLVLVALVEGLFLFFMFRDFAR